MPAAIDDLEWRRLIAQSTDRQQLRDLLASGPVTFYCGFDPTASSLHLGNLLQILTARRLQLAGHRPILLVGGATGLIGDPKLAGERHLNPAEIVSGWAGAIRSQLEHYFDFDGESAATFVDNYEWTAELSAIGLLRDLGKHFSVNQMLHREAVAARLSGSGISYTEFSYQVLQANDFLELRRRFGCELQTGGSDQWGNIVGGIDLVRRVDGIAVHGITTPLITKADGAKFGKTESGTVWLDASMTSPYAFYQFWINADDRDVPTLLRSFSLGSWAEIEDLESEAREAPGVRAAQRHLAREMTALVHGHGQASAAELASRALFGHEPLGSLSASVLGQALAETTVIDVPRGGPWPSAPEAAARAGLVPSKAAGRRAVAEGGLYVNNLRVEEADRRLTPEEAMCGEWIVLRRGKRSIAGVRVRG